MNTSPYGRVFPCYFEFSQTSTSVSVTYGNREKMSSISFYKVTRRKLNTLKYPSLSKRKFSYTVNDGVCDGVCDGV